MIWPKSSYQPGYAWYSSCGHKKSIEPEAYSLMYSSAQLHLISSLPTKVTNMQKRRADRWGVTPQQGEPYAVTATLNMASTIC